LFVSYCYFTVSYILILLSPRWFVGNPNIFQVAHQQNSLLFNSICFFGYSFSWKSRQDFFTANSMEEIKENLDSIITMYDCVLLFSVLWSFRILPVKIRLISQLIFTKYIGWFRLFLGTNIRLCHTLHD
jgi:hypothetical protein